MSPPTTLLKALAQLWACAQEDTPGRAHLLSMIQPKSKALTQRQDRVMIFSYAAKLCSSKVELLYY